MSDTKEIVFLPRPFEGQLSNSALSLSEILNSIATELGTEWSFVGGFPRDIYHGFQPNDFDVCIAHGSDVIRIMREMKVLEHNVQQSPEEIPHDYFIDPYSFDGSKYPIHWINPENRYCYAPTTFDFSINQISLKGNRFYAPDYAWSDFDKKIIRRVSERLTTNLVLRAIRFAAKLDFSIHPSLKDDILSKANSRVDTEVLIKNLKKMQEDGVGEKSFALIQHYGFEFSSHAKNIDDYIYRLEKAIRQGEGFSEPRESSY